MREGEGASQDQVAEVAVLNAMPHEVHVRGAALREGCHRGVQGQGRLQRVAVALWTPDEAAALCDRNRMRLSSGVNLGLSALFNVGVKHSDPCSCTCTHCL